MLEKVVDKVNILTPSGIRKVSAKATELDRQGHKVIHLELGRPDFDTPEYIKKTAVDSINAGRVFYTSNYGTNQLREAIASNLKKRNNVDYKMDEILVTVGLSEAIFCILNTILEEGEEILVPDPVWMNYINIPRFLGANPVKYQLLESNKYQPDIAEMESQITSRTKAIVINSPNNPTGSVLSGDTLEKISAMAVKHDLIVISDEVYDRIIYSSNPCTSIASIEGMKQRTITLNGFSKAYSMTGWRLGYMAGPADMITTINKMHQIITTCATTFVQDAAVSALEEECDEVELMVKEYRKRRDYITNAINSIDGFSCLEPQGAFYLFVNIKKTGMSSDEMADFLLNKAYVATVPGSVFGEGGEGYIRLSYASGMDNLMEAVERIKIALEKNNNEI